MQGCLPAKGRDLSLGGFWSLNIPHEVAEENSQGVFLRVSSCYWITGGIGMNLDKLLNFNLKIAHKNKLFVQGLEAVLASIGNVCHHIMI